MTKARELAWVLVLAAVFGGGLVLLANPKHVADVKRKAAGQEWVFQKIPSPTYIDPRDQDHPLRPDGTFAGITAPHSDPNHWPTQPAYPPESKRLKEAGTVIMMLTVQPDGHVSAAEVSLTSGYDRLDQAATEEAVKWHLLPGTIDGKPAAMRYKFAVTFKITD